MSLRTNGKRLSRRAFVQESILGVMAASACGGRVFAESSAGPATPVSANDKLSIAVLGVRGRGQDHAQAYASRNDCVVAYFCDPDREIGQSYADRFAARFGYRPKFVTDMREIFADAAVDAVSIATPNHWHALAAVWAIQAGKHVYVEKPVSHNLSEGRRIVQAARKYGKICQGGTQRRSDGVFRDARALVEKIGPVRVVRCVMYRQRNPIGPPGDYPVPPSVDYNLWAGPAPMAKVTRRSFHYDWHWFWDFGNGEIGNNCVHAVDTARIIVPVPNLGKGVLCYGGRPGFHDAGETPNTQVSIHDLGRLTLVQEVRNFKTPPPFLGGTVLVVGEDGYVATSMGNRVTRFDKDGKEVETISGTSTDHFGNFVEAVKASKPEMLNADIEEVHVSSAFTHLANVSYRLGRPADPASLRAALDKVPCNEDTAATLEAIASHLRENGVDLSAEPLTLGRTLAFDPAAERFVDDAEADALLTRTYREPFVMPSAEEL
ncbi:MAG: Gfo/Idh/MocA family protein [Thermogutta sp.]